MALTRHREVAHVYTDRQTFADRDPLDGSLSRTPSKELARDYAAAAIEVIVCEVGLHGARLSKPRSDILTSSSPPASSPHSLHSLLY
ncbi:MAG TPA: hypothetical protein VOA80_05320 [Thermoanaerobaculia bacterium]|nr:hypothetical protein [Thermoanaerobaculia bacterium]